MKPVVLALIVCGAFAGLAGSASAEGDGRPMVLTTKQYICLHKYARQLKVGMKGAMIDFTACPPKVIDNFMPLPPSKTRRLFSPAALECLAKAKRGAGVAFRRPDGGVEVYLDPCGK